MDFAVFVLGVTAIWATGSGRRSVRRWAPIIGLAAQPFWFALVWPLQSFWLQATVVVYTLAWLRVAWTYWGAWCRFYWMWRRAKRWKA